MNILAFDLGASGGKLFLASIGREQVSMQEIHRFDNISYPVNDCLFWSILNIYNEMNSGIRKAIQITDDNIDSFAIDSFSNDFGFIDKHGALLSPVRCYRDNRTKRHQDAIFTKLAKPELYRLSGNQHALFNTLMQLAAMREDGHGFLLDNADKLLFIPDLLIYFLTGKAISEYTLSSVSQMYSFEKDDWCQDILDTFEIPRRLFGALTKPGVIIGHTKESYNQMHGTKGFPVSIVCEHDTASAYLSSPLAAGSVLISCGTWALIGTELEHSIITPESYAANIANEGSIEGHHRLLRNIMSSWFIQETKRYYRSLGEEYSFSQLDDMARAATPFKCFFDPDESEFFNPGNMPEKIQNSCMRHCGYKPETLGELIRCIYESLALKFRWTISQLELVSQKPLSIINMMGGGCQASLLCQFTANATNRKVIAGPIEATAIGNITIQLMATGAAASLEEAKQIMKSSYTTIEYLPEDSNIWDTQYEKYLSLL